MADRRAEIIERYFEKNYTELFGPYNVPVGQVILEKAEKYVVRPSTVAALVEKESGGRDIFGCDLGKRNTAPWCRQRVTRERLDALIRWVKNGGNSNGVGWTQLTYFPFIEMAEDRGGAHLPDPNIDVGVEEIKRLFVRYDNGTPMGWRAAVASYNGGESNRSASVPQAYAFDVEKKAAAWRERLGGEGDEKGNGGQLLKGLMENVATVKEYGLALLNDRHPQYWCWDGGSLDRTVNGRPGCEDGAPPQMARIGKIFCFTGDTTVVSPPVEKSYRRLYSGEVVAIETASGNRLTGTPNHPILTDKGWLPLKALHEGAYVLSSPGFRQLAGSDPDYYHKPCSLEQMHRSLADSGLVDGYPGGPLDFHGDGRDGEVEVVIPGRILRNRRVPEVFEEALKLALPYPAQPDPALAVLRLPHKEAAGVGSSSSLVGGADLGESSFSPQIGVLQPLGLGVAANVGAGLFEPSLNGAQAYTEPCGDGSGRFAADVCLDDGAGIERESLWGGPASTSSPPMEAVTLSGAAELDTGPIQPLFDTLGGHAEPARDLWSRLPADVRRDKIVSVDVKPFFGHVYNLQTEPGHYVANGIISHNCADLLSLQLRHLGKPVPKNHIWPGGTRSFKLRYGSVMRPMRLSELQEGDVPFVDFETRWAPEGHIAFCLGDGPNARLLQSFAKSCSTLEPGLNDDFTVAQSHDGGYYTHYIPREKIWD